MKRSIETKEEFEKFMLEIDEKLQKGDVPIHMRQLAAVGLASEILEVELKIVSPQVAATPGVYTGDSLTAHIRDWFGQRYGDRLKMKWSIGYSVVLLKGDAWLIRFPEVYGHVKIICDRDLSRQYNSTAANSAGKPRQEATMNLLKLIEKCPQGLADILTDDELQSLLDYFNTGYTFFMKMYNFGRANDLAVTSVADLETSARFAVDTWHNYGQSLWVSLQAAEKILKFFISKKGGNFKYTHNLKELAEKAHDIGLEKIEERVIDLVQCKAEVRYSQNKYDIGKVVDAHQAALKIGSLVTHSLWGKR